MSASESSKPPAVKVKSESALPPREVRPPRKLLLFIGGGIIAVIAIVVTVLFLTVWSQPNTEDFTQTQADVNKLETSYEAISNASNDFRAQLKKDPANVKEEKGKLSSVITTHAEKIEAIASQKSLRDTDVKNAFETFDAKNNKFVAYVKGYNALQESFTDCIKVFQVTRTTDGTPKAIAEAHKKLGAECQPVLETLASSSIGAISEYGKNFSDTINERQKTFEAVANKSMSQSEGAKKINELGKVFNEKSDSLPDKLAQARKDSSVYTELKALKDLLGKRVGQ